MKSLPRRLIRRTALVALALPLAFVVVSGYIPAGATTTISLDNATGYAVIANQSITNTGLTTISGNVALSPGTSDGLTSANLTSGVINDTNIAAADAQASNVAAYTVAASAVPTATVVGGDLTGATLTPGVYHSTSSLAISTGGVLTLNAQNDPAAVWIFQAPASTLVLGSSSSVVLENDASACNVFWQVGSSATLGTTSP